MRTTVVYHRRLVADLVRIQAHLGGHKARVGLPQDPCSLGFRGRLCLHNPERAVADWKRALTHLDRPVVVVGCPRGTGELCEALFKAHGIPFFTRWRPGFLTEALSKPLRPFGPRHKRGVLVVYDPRGHGEACHEATQTQTLLVGIDPLSSGLPGPDYSVSLSFEGLGGGYWYVKFWEALLRRRAVYWGGVRPTQRALVLYRRLKRVGAGVRPLPRFPETRRFRPSERRRNPHLTRSKHGTHKDRT